MSGSIQKSGFTKTGFSRNGFACCSRHFLCENGKKECFYYLTDPEVPTLCSAYQREHNTIHDEISSFLSSTFSTQIEKEKSMEEVLLREDEQGQLSLF